MRGGKRRERARLVARLIPRLVVRLVARLIARLIARVVVRVVVRLVVRLVVRSSANGLADGFAARVVTCLVDRRLVARTQQHDRGVGPLAPDGEHRSLLLLLLNVSLAFVERGSRRPAMTMVEASSAELILQGLAPPPGCVSMPEGRGVGGVQGNQHAEQDDRQRSCHHDGKEAGL